MKPGKPGLFLFSHASHIRVLESDVLLLIEGYDPFNVPEMRACADEKPILFAIGEYGG